MKVDMTKTVLTLVAFLAACGGGETQWSGTITDSAGVVMVTNGGVGLWPQGEGWTVEEDLRIGALEGAPEYQIGQVGDIALDSEGRIHVLDAQAQHIRVYSPDGIYQSTIGARGGGPGELGYGLALLMAPGDTILVPDGRNLRFTRYAPDGSEAGSVRLDPDGAWPMVFRASTQGAIFTQVRTFALPNQPALENQLDFLLRLASDGTVADTLMNFPSGSFQNFDGSGITFFAPEPVWDVTGDGRIILAVNDEYRIGIYSDGQLERVIEKSYQLTPVSEADKEALRAELKRRFAAQGMPEATMEELLRRRFHFAEFLPAILTVRAGPRGTIWTQQARSPSELSEAEFAGIRENHLEDLGSNLWDVFDPEGRFLGVVTLPRRFTPGLFRDEAIYGVWRDELNVEYVVRLRLVGELGADAT
jgi:hypothetical protein